jgi:hypothetical protein
MKNPLFNMKSVKKGSYKANDGDVAGSGAETFRKPEPERNQKVSAPQQCRKIYCITPPPMALVETI